MDDHPGEGQKISLTKRSEDGFRALLISITAAVIGVVAGFVAYGLYSLIALLSNLVFFQQVSLKLPAMQSNHLGLWIILIPALGGLIVGVMAKYGSDKIRGHGIPEAMEAVVVNQSRIAPRVAILKPISAAIATGTGGPFGAEGPIIQTGGALGSLVGQVFHTTAAERKILLACGAAAGMAATFSTPIAAVILAIELLLFEFKSRSFIPLVIASTMATTVHFALMGKGPMFKVNPIDFGIPANLPFYLLLGLVCGLAATGYSKALYWIEDRFESLPIDRMWWPVLGGVVVGVIGFFVPRVLGVGYDVITDILNGSLPLAVLLSLALFKSLALLVSLGSGTSGGLLAPLFMAGAALGGAYALLINRIFPGAHLSPAAFALVAMAAIFGAASRATFTFIIFAMEITHDYNAILPLMLVSVIADGVAIMTSRNSIMTEKLSRRGLHIPTEYEADAFQTVTVDDVMERNPISLPATMPVSQLADGIARSDPVLSRHQAFPIVDDTGRLRGIITRGDVLKALEEQPQGDISVLSAGSNTPFVTYPDELVKHAVDKMLHYEIGRLPVVDRQDPDRLVGYLSRAGVLAARKKRFHEETVREPGWLTLPKLSRSRREPVAEDE